MTKEELHEMVATIDPVNQEYILKNGDIQKEFEWINSYENKGRADMADYCIEKLLEKIHKFDSTHLVPSNAKVGEGATVLLWSDRHAGTIVKVTPKTIQIRRDKAVLDPNWKPEIIPGGFAGHCVNQADQSYTYELDPDGCVYRFVWSDKHQSYGRPNDLRAIKGRHEFYDFNF